MQLIKAIKIKGEFIRTHTPGLILCAEEDSAIAKYALEELPNKTFPAEHKLALRYETKLTSEVQEMRESLRRKES